jgi:hypothetical protein
VPPGRRSLAFAQVPPEIAASNDEIARGLPPGEFIDQLRLLGPDGQKLRFFDDGGRPMAPDRWHLTRFGARFEAGRLPARAPAAWEAMARALRHKQAPGT